MQNSRSTPTRVGKAESESPVGHSVSHRLDLPGRSSAVIEVQADSARLYHFDSDYGRDALLQLRRLIDAALELMGGSHGG